MLQDLKNYLSFHALHYPYFCFDQDGCLYVSAGQSSRPTRKYGYHWEVSQQEVSLPAGGERTRRDAERMFGSAACIRASSWKNRTRWAVSPSPSGLVHDGSHLIVADSGNNRLADPRERRTPGCHASRTTSTKASSTPFTVPPRWPWTATRACMCWSRRSRERRTSRSSNARLAVLQQDYLRAAEQGPRGAHETDQAQELAGTASVGRFSAPASECGADRRRRRSLPAAGLGGQRVGAGATAADSQATISRFRQNTGTAARRCRVPGRAATSPS